MKAGSPNHFFPCISGEPSTTHPWEETEESTWKHLPEWAYHKAPTTKDHRFSAYNHNWTAGVLYERDACWVGCRRCTVQCHTKDRQTTFETDVVLNKDSRAHHFSH